MDPLSAVADEVALEGLDGITIPTLWIRLQDRQPRFPLKLDDPTKGLIWRFLASHDDLRFYELPVAREDVVLVDRFKDIDPETGIEITETFSDTTKDIYPIHTVPENKDGIQGSCMFFKQRTDITKHVRSKSLTPLVQLEEAMERYGRKVVVVASQALRFRTLIGSESDPDLKLGDDSYCVLEKVGRARWQGELQTDMHGSSFKIDARRFHYLRKSLVRHQLVTMQSYLKRLQSGQQQYSILLLLKRFHINRRTKYDILMEQVSNFLAQLPDQLSTMVGLKDQLNMTDNAFRRLLKYMRAAKFIDFCQIPLEDLDPSAGPCTNKNGSKVLVRCLKLIKPYVKKGLADDDDDDDDDEDVDRSSGLAVEGRILEKDVLSQAYDIVLSCGTKGIPQRDLCLRMNIGKLESRMLCRKLEGDGMIKGFMEDEGRQRTTKFISHRCVGVSDRLQMFAEEQARNKRLSSAAPQILNTELAASKAPANSKSSAKGRGKTKNKRTGTGVKKEEEEEQISGDQKGSDRSQRKRGEGRRKSGGRRKAEETTEETQLQTPVLRPECETVSCSESVPSDPVESSPADQTPAESEQSSSACGSSLPQTEESITGKNPSDNNIVVVKNLSHPPVPRCGKSQKSLERSHETYRLLRRKNLIVEAVQNLKIIEGLFPLQKMINEEEKQDGVSSKCCKKTILRLVHCLSREGLLKIYTTTVVQDGITKKVDLIVHPSIQPSDDRVNQVIEQVRFKISSSYSAVRQQHTEEKAREVASSTAEGSSSKGHRSKADRKKGGLKEEEFKPVAVRGLSKTLGFQPKMHRLRVIHTFLWYLIYGHPQNTSTSPTPSDPTVSPPDTQKDLNVTENSPSSRTPSPTCSVNNLDELCDDDAEEPSDKTTSSHSQYNLKAYSDEDSWKRFVPPVRVHKEFGRGWAMVGDLLLCLPLSLYVQIIQVNYKVEGLEEYLDDPVKQHFLIRALPAKTRRQLLYKRKYIFVFYENLQRLTYMGLLQFGPVEKFKEKDQVFVYLRRNTTIVDTSHAEPHYWLVTESLDKPFDRRQYTLNTADDVENYWFDLMCVCLNTPLGVIRGKRNATDDEAEPTIVHDRSVFVGMAYLLKGCREPCDDGSIPGDGKGAGGLDSEFFGHLKRNWLWTNHLLSVKGKPTGSEAQETKSRLRSLLSRNALRIALSAEGPGKPHYLTTKRPPIAENVEVGIEPASRNQQVVGGKKQKRRRAKKDPVKAPRKKRKVSADPKKRTPAHDEADHKALKMMTRQRVYWSVQEDSLMMLCCVASQLLNSKLKRPFVPHCVVRDLLQMEFEISQDKTSLSVGRRSRYILKNPQTLLNYRICLAEAYQDKALMKLLEEKKPVNPEKPEDCAKSFSEYARLLRQKFSSILTTCDLVIPDSKQELFSRFKISAIDTEKWVTGKDNIRCTDDIHAIVLHNLIQSTLAMTNSQMKSSRSFQTFHMYSKYDQELLCQVFIQCRKKGLVNRRRVSQSFGPKKNRALPILPMSYQLSQSYYRCFSWRFPHPLLTDCFRFLRSLIDNGTEDHRPVTEFYHETETRSEGDEDVLEKKMALKRQEKQSPVKEDSRSMSEKGVQTERRNSDSVKEETLMKEGPISQIDKGTESTLKSGSDEASLSGEKTVNDVLETPKAAAPPSEDPPDVSDMLQFSLEAPGGACLVSLSLMTLGLLRVHMSIPKQVVVVDSTLVDNDVVKSMAALEEDDEDEDDGEDCEGKKRMQVKAHQASHTNYLMMRGYCAPGIVKLRNLNTSDNIVVESCRMRLQLRNTPAHHIFPEETLPPLDLAKCGPSLIPPILTYTIHSSPSSPPTEEESERRLIQRRGYSRQDVEACAQLRRTLDEAGEKGLDEHELQEAHLELQEPQCGRARELQHYMKDLEDEGEMVRVGSLSVRWVLMRHAAPWLLTVNTQQWSQSRLTPDRLNYLKKQHHVPFMRKRCIRGTHPEEPAAKRQAADEEESGTSTRETTNEQEVEGTEEGSGDEPIKLEKEGGKQTGEETEEKEQRLDSIEEEREEEAGSPPAESVDDDENVSFVSRPWRLVDGKLNRQVCKGMLEAVLFHIMSRPGVTQQALFGHYKDLLQPTSVLELLQALTELGCVTKKVLVKAPKPSLFARPAHPPSSEVKTEDSECVFYEPTISCCLRLSQVLPNERHWSSCIP